MTDGYPVSERTGFFITVWEVAGDSIPLKKNMVGKQAGSIPNTYESNRPR